MSESIIIYITNVIYSIKVLSIISCIISLFFFIFFICDYEDNIINYETLKRRFKKISIIFIISLILSILLSKKDICYNILKCIIK